MRNMGAADRLIRVVISLVILYVAIMIDMVGYLRIILGVIGGIILITSITGFCGLYRIFGVCTCKKGTCSCGSAKKDGDNMNNNNN